jgi:hypothetical protein
MVIERFKQESSELKKEVRERTVGYIVAAMGLVAGLAWNEAIRSLIDHFFPQSNGLWAKFLYAALVTIVVVVISTYLVRLTAKRE